MNLWQRIKQAFMKYLADLEKENQKAFGSGAPDCCNLNRQAGKHQAGKWP